MNYRMIDIKTIFAPGAGQLSFFEGTHDIPFEIKRIYFISGVPESVKRGAHAHKKLKQFLFCPYGEIEIVLDDATTKESILLNSPSKGLLIEEPFWRDTIWKKSDSVLCVAASDYYTEKDYIRNYQDFVDLKRGGYKPDRIEKYDEKSFVITGRYAI